MRANKNEEAVGEQEMILNGDITTLGFLVENANIDKVGAKDALKRAANYRREFPMALPDPVADRALEHALSLATP
jgi:hypothetical protein